MTLSLQPTFCQWKWCEKDVTLVSHGLYHPGSLSANLDLSISFSEDFCITNICIKAFSLITSINIEWVFNYSQNSRIKSIDKTRGPWVLSVTRVFSHPLSIFTFISRADGLWTKSALIILIIVSLFRCRLFLHEKQTESLSGKKTPKTQTLL